MGTVDHRTSREDRAQLRVLENQSPEKVRLAKAALIESAVALTVSGSLRDPDARDWLKRIIAAGDALNADVDKDIYAVRIAAERLVVYLRAGETLSAALRKSQLAHALTEIYRARSDQHAERLGFAVVLVEDA